MANPNDYISALQGYHPDVDLNGVLGGQAQQAASSGQSINDFVSKYAQDPAITQAYVNKYTAFAQPQLANFDSQIGIQRQQQQLNNTQNATQQSMVGQQFDNNAYNLNQNRNQEVGAAMQQAYSSGINRSSFAPVATARIGANTQQALGYNDAQRANNLASLAIQNQQNNLQSEGTIGNLTGEKSAIQANIGQQAQQDSYNNSQNYYNRQLSTLQAVSSPNLDLLSTSPAYAQAYAQLLSKAGLGTANVADIMSSAKAAKAKATGGSVSSGGGTSYSSAPASTASKTATPIDTSAITSYLTNYFKGGGWQGQDATDLSHLASKYGIDQNLASQLYYHTRKAVVGQ